MQVALMFCSVCGEPAVPHRVNRSTVTLKCGACGATGSANCTVGVVDLPEGELRQVHRESSKSPGRDKTSKQDPEDKTEWVRLRFRLTTDQREVVQRALRAIRVLLRQHGDERVDGRVWHGVALEFLCADALAGTLGEYAKYDAPAAVPGVRDDQRSSFTCEWCGATDDGEIHSPGCKNA